MKIWNLVTDSDAGTFSEIFYSEALRDARCYDLCADQWDAEDGPMSADWRVAYAVMQGKSCDWWFHLSEHDLSNHPFVLQIANLLDREDIYVTSDVGEAIEQILNGDGSIVDPQGDKVDEPDTAASDALIEAGYYEGPWSENVPTGLPGDDMDRMCPVCGMTCEC